jgi:hypothetical protein
MERVEDFKRSLEAFLDGMITRQKEVSGKRSILKRTLNAYILQLIDSWEEYQSTLLQKSEANPEPNRPEGDEESSAVSSAA